VANDDPDEAEVGDRRFSLLEITSGLPDDSQGAAGRIPERRPRVLRAAVKAARAMVATAPGLADMPQSNGRRVVRFYARFNGTRGQFQFGVPKQ
jgi:hypothetical protein